MSLENYKATKMIKKHLMVQRISNVKNTEHVNLLMEKYKYCL